jgi:hypothetical protein
MTEGMFNPKRRCQCQIYTRPAMESAEAARMNYAGSGPRRQPAGTGGCCALNRSLPRPTGLQPPAVCSRNNHIKSRCQRQFPPCICNAEETRARRVRAGVDWPALGPKHPSPAPYLDCSPVVCSRKSSSTFSPLAAANPMLVAFFAMSPRERQGLTLVHFSAQLEPCLTHKNTLHILNTL